MSPYMNNGEHPTILAISHNNFDHPDHVDYKSSGRISVRESDLNFMERTMSKNHSSNPHHMDLQLINKLIILKKLLKYDLEDCKIIFVGHSVGCYIILKILQDPHVKSAHQGSIFIHPALENIATTARGSRIKILFNYKLDLIGQIIAFILDNCLPKSTKLTITRWFCGENFTINSSGPVIESITQLICQKTFRALVQMAKSEFAMVKNINPETMVKPHESKLRIVYASGDGWVNEQSKRLLRDSCPNLYMEEQICLHAFVMDPDMALNYAFRTSRHIMDLFRNNS